MLFRSGDSYPADSVGARSLGVTALLDRGVRFEGCDRSDARSWSVSLTLLGLVLNIDY